MADKDPKDMTIEEMEAECSEYRDAERKEALVRELVHYRKLKAVKELTPK